MCSLMRKDLKHLKNNPENNILLPNPSPKWQNQVNGVPAWVSPLAESPSNKFFQPLVPDNFLCISSFVSHFLYFVNLFLQCWLVPLSAAWHLSPYL